MKKVTVAVEKFEAYDGMIFDTEKECIHYERIQLGIRKKCSYCNGAGEVDPCGDGRTLSTCSVCSGKGWVEKKEVWE